MVRPSETQAGSEGTARAEMEASRNLGDPTRSSQRCGVPGLNGPSIGTGMPHGKSDPLVVLGARESRAHGEAAEQRATCAGKRLLHTEVVFECQRNCIG